MSDWFSLLAAADSAATALPPTPPKPTKRTMRDSIEAELMSYTRNNLEQILYDDLALRLPAHRGGAHPGTKRELISEYIYDFTLPQLAALARRIINDLGQPAAQLAAMLAEYDRISGGVTGTMKNLIFAANGAKPELVLRDATNNDVEIVRNAEYCLIFDQPLPPEGLTYRTLIAWWRDKHEIPGDDRAVGLDLHKRLRDSMNGNKAELALFDAYQPRYKTLGFDIPALIPQVYLHYDPYTKQARGGSGPLERQRMDFLMLYSDRRRVVIEVDGVQHYAEENKTASPDRYAAMVAEDRRLRLAGYEVYRFGGAELFRPGAEETLRTFFADLHDRR